MLGQCWGMLSTQPKNVTMTKNWISATSCFGHGYKYFKVTREPEECWKRLLLQEYGEGGVMCEDVRGAKILASTNTRRIPHKEVPRNRCKRRKTTPTGVSIKMHLQL